MQGRTPSWRLVVSLVALVAVVVGGVITLTGGGSSPAREGDQDPAWAHGHEVPNALREAANEGRDVHEAKFERGRGKEAGREGPSNPAAEQVAERAYPRSYVDDALAQKAHKAFQRLPHKGTTAAAQTRVATRALVSGPWAELGPFTPNVAGPDSQFFDPATLTGPTTQESGRVTALAIDPACAPGNCRMWVAAAGGGIWRTNDALASHVTWIAPPANLPTTAFGSLLFAGGNTIYAGSGEQNGSGDSEAGLGLFKSTDGGASWSVVGNSGTAGVALNRAIGAIAVDPTDSNTIYIGTDVGRHGSSAVNGGRFTPPNAPTLGVYKSTNGGANFSLLSNLSDQTPPNPNPPESGADWFQGGINKIEFDPTNNDVYAAVIGYGVWRSQDGGTTWSQVFHTMNQNDFSDVNNPVGDTFGDRTEFDLVPNGSGHTMAYLGDASDDWVLDGDDTTPLPEAWRVNSIDAKSAAALVGVSDDNVGWTMLSNQTNGTTGFGVYGFCQNGQCGYDEAVAAPNVNSVWFLGSMNYDELPAYDQFGTGAPPRSNGRAVVRSTNPTAGTNTTAKTTVSWQDMTAVLSDPSQGWGVQSGIHPDLHAIAFANSGDTAFIGSDGGVVRIDVTSTRDQSASCSQRQYNYDSTDPTADPVDLQPDDLADCQDWLSAVPNSVTPLNDGLRTLQFQSLSVNPSNPSGDLLGGTQDNGTWSYTGSPTWLETIGGDGGQSGFDSTDPTNVRYHTYYDATPEVNFHGTDPTKWLDIYDTLQVSNESRSFYTPFIADPTMQGHAFIGMQHVWRTDDNGGNEADLIDNGCLAYALDPFRPTPCGDFVHIGRDLTGSSFGTSKRPAGDFIAALERAPSDNGTMWAATKGGRVLVTSNANAAPASVQFFRIDNPSTPSRFVSGIAIDPSNPNHAWVSYSGYSAYSPGGHVYEVVYNPTTHSATFTNLSANLPDTPVTGIAQDEVSGALFAATDFGVLELAPGSGVWTTAGSGLPNVSTFGLTLSHQGRVLYAATHGRGAWKLALPLAPPPQGGSPTGAIHGRTTLELGHKATYTATGSTPNGGNVTFKWSLPGRPSSATGSPVSFTPTKVGVQSIVLTISDSTGASTVVTQAVTVKRKTTVKLHRVKPVALGQRSTISGTISAAAGVKSVKISFGDGSRSRTVHLRKHGKFTVKHRYRKAKTYKVKITVSDKAGYKTTKTVRAKVL